VRLILGVFFFWSSQSLLASILSILAMTYSDTGKRDTLYYRIYSQSTEAPGTWGHEYVRHLAAELGEEYNARFNGFIEEEDQEKKDDEGDEKVDGSKREYTVEQLRGLAMELVDFCLQHNAEADAVDLLLELECIEGIVERVDDKTWPRVCQYMVS
jgi:26S proteasome regulatory subunit N1